MVREVNEAFLVGLAEIAATLVGTFLVGVFFYLESDRRRTRRAEANADQYLRSGVRGVFVVSAIPLLVPLALASLDAVWGALVFVALSALLVAATVDSVRKLLRRGGSWGSAAIVVNEVVDTTAALFIVTLPWVAERRWVPPPSAFVPSLVLALGSGFFSTVALVMTLFDRSD